MTMIALLSAKIVTVTMTLTTSGAPFEFLSNWNNNIGIRQSEIALRSMLKDHWS